MGSESVAFGQNTWNLVLLGATPIAMCMFLLSIEKLGADLISKGNIKGFSIGRTIQVFFDLIKLMDKQDPKRGVLKKVLAFSPMLFVTVGFCLIPMTPHYGTAPGLASSQGAGLFSFPGISSSGSFLILLAIAISALLFQAIGAWSQESDGHNTGLVRVAAAALSTALLIMIILSSLALSVGTLDVQQLLLPKAIGLDLREMSSFWNLNLESGWGVVRQPLGALLYLGALTAYYSHLGELVVSGRLSSDFARADTAGGPLRLCLIISEKAVMIFLSAVFVVSFMGSSSIPLVAPIQVYELTSAALGAEYGRMASDALFYFAFWFKVFLLISIVIAIRMAMTKFSFRDFFGFLWKSLLPWSVINFLLTAIWIFIFS